MVLSGRWVCVKMNSTLVLWEGPQKCGFGVFRVLNATLSFRDGSPYCEKDYQGLFGVKCEACHQFITGKVLEVSTEGSPQTTTICCGPSSLVSPPEEEGE